MTVNPPIEGTGYFVPWIAGDLSGEKLESIVSGLSDGATNRLRKVLEPHIDQPIRVRLEDVDHSLTRGAPITGAYSADDAEKWILEQREAMSEVPESPFRIDGRVWPVSILKEEGDT